MARPVKQAGLERLLSSAMGNRPLMAGLPGSGMLVVDADLRILLSEGVINEQCDAYPQLDRRVPDVMPAGDWDRARPYYEAALAGRIQSFVFRPSDLGDTVLSVRLAPIRDEGTIIGVLALFHDISPRIEADRRLAESERLQHSVLEVLEEGVCVVERSGRLRHANAAASAILGTELDAGDDDPDWWEALRIRHLGEATTREVAASVLASGVGRRRLRFELERDGDIVGLSVNYLPLRTAGGAISGLVISFRDVTEYRRERAELARSQVDLREAHDFFQATLDSLDAHVAVLCDKGRILMTNRAWRQFAAANGSPRDDVGADYLAACDGNADDPIAIGVAAGLRAIIDGDEDRYTVEYPCHAPDAQRWFLLRAARFEGPGDAAVVVSHDDITSRRESEAQLLRQAQLLDEVDFAVVARDLDGLITEWNRGAEQLYGWTRDEAVGREATEMLLPADAASREVLLAEFARTGHRESELTVRRKDGTTFLALVRDRLMLGSDGRPEASIAIAVDMTERAAAEQSLASARDYLRAVTESMGQGLFALDPDGRVAFINAAAEKLLGWPRGELVGQPIHDLTHTRLDDGTRLCDDDCPIVHALRVGVPARVDDDVFVRRDGDLIPVEYTAAPFETEDGVEGCVVVFDDISERKANEVRLREEAEKLLWIGRIQEALANDRFVLFAQPIVDLADDSVVQRELLLRLREPSGEIIGPAAYLAVAEEYGMMGEIDRWVIEQATHLAAGGEPVEVNLSARSVSDLAVLDHIERCLDTTGVDPTCLVFEITETAIIEDQVAARAFAERLRHLGCRLALDDFGTGYGGFTYLKQIPVDFLKIDVEFVRDLASNPASGHVVQAVVALARAFGLKTVAEGIEDEASLALLRDLGVDYGQGFHLGRPRPIDAAPG